MQRDFFNKQSVAVSAVQGRDARARWWAKTRSFCPILRPHQVWSNTLCLRVETVESQILHGPQLIEAFYCVQIAVQSIALLEVCEFLCRCHILHSAVSKFKQSAFYIYTTSGLLWCPRELENQTVCLFSASEFVPLITKYWRFNDSIWKPTIFFSNWNELCFWACQKFLHI